MLRQLHNGFYQVDQKKKSYWNISVSIKYLCKEIVSVCCHFTRLCCSKITKRNCKDLFTELFLLFLGC